MEVIELMVVAVVVAFLCGSLPFSSWLAGLAGKDIRRIGDGNPGASNVFHTGSRMLGAAALLLDFFKAFVPVFVFLQVLRPVGAGLVLLAVAPVLGHAFMPWRGFKGGKGVNATFGIWTGLSLWVVPVSLGMVLAVLVLFFKKLPDAFKVMVGMAAVAPVLAWSGAPWEWWVVFVLNLLLLAYTHRKELTGGRVEGGGRDAS